MVPIYLVFIIGLGFFYFGFLAAKTDSSVKEIKRLLDMIQKKKITCRYGVPYEVEFKGTKGEIQRGFNHCEKCCCWTCYNRDCKQPRNEIIDNCGHVCEIWTKKHYCKK